MKNFIQLRKLLKWAWFIVVTNILVIFGMIVAAIGILQLKPHWIFNDSLLRFLAGLAQEKQIADVSWGGSVIQVEANCFTNESTGFNVKFQNLCAGPLGLGPRVCWKNADLSFRVGKVGEEEKGGRKSFLNFMPKITEVGPIRLRDGQLVLPPSRGGQSTTTPEESASLSLQHFREHASQLSNFLTSLRGISFRSIVVSLRYREAKQKEVKFLFEGENERFNVFLELKDWIFEGGPLFSGKLHLLGNVKENQVILTATLSGKESGIPHKRSKVQAVRGGGAVASRSFTASLDGQILDLMNLNKIQLKLSGNGQNLFPSVSTLGIEDCTFDLRRRDTLPFLGNFKVNCPLWVQLPVLFKDQGKFEFPDRAYFNIKSEMNSVDYPFSPDSELQGWAALVLNPLSAPWIKSHGKVLLNFKGIPRDFPGGWRKDLEASLGFRTPQFETLVKHFTGTPWAVPAPFHVLKGSLALDVQGNSNLKEGRFLLSLKTRLKSEHQKVNLEGRGSLQLSDIEGGLHSKLPKLPNLEKSAKLDFKLSLSEVVLELPRLDLAAPPRIVPEPNLSPLKKTQEARPGSSDRTDKKEGALSYNLQIKTPDDHPLKILSNLAKAPIPMDIQLFLNSDNNSAGFINGSIRVKDFPLEVFRRNATLNYFDIALASPAASSKINGLITVKYVDYTIFIYMNQTLGKPAITLQSDPPLPENKLVATLLFGKPMEELDADQQKSVGSTRAAIADTALGVVSLYALASTPIQSVGYDSTSHVFTAKLRLGEGTSLNLGANADGFEDIGIRKRLGSKWSITTDLTHSKMGEQNKAVSTFLEWVHRY